jgi:transcriptional regulator with XRE-family HTH domain
MPTLGQEIRRLREEKGWNQKELCDEADLDYSILSRIESGKSKTPSEQTVRILARALKVPEDSLLSLAAGLRERDRSTLRLGAAHCIWSAPVILLAMQGRLPGVSITTYGVVGRGGTSGLGDPYWYDEDTLKTQRFVRAGPAFVDCQAPRLSQVQPWPDKEQQAYTANDLISLLKCDPPKLDGIIAAKEAVRNFSSGMVLCSRLLQTKGGCSLLVGLSQKKLGELGMSQDSRPETFQEFWARVSRDILPCLPTLSAPGTIAEGHVDLIQQAHSENKPMFYPVDYVAVGMWNEVTAAVRKALHGDEADGCGAVAFVGWEPQLSWVAAMLEGLGATCYMTSHLAEFTDRERLPPLLYDIILREDAVDGMGPDRGTPFFNLLSAAVKELNDLRSATSSVVKLVSSYLNLSPDRCFQALSGLNFELMFYPEWVAQLKR